MVIKKLFGAKAFSDSSPPLEKSLDINFKRCPIADGRISREIGGEIDGQADGGID